MKSKVTFYITCYFVCCHFLFYGQNEASKWYYDGGNALDFMVTPPSNILNSQMYTGSCSASIADAAGNLLFYTDGATIWNAQNLPMLNGTNVLSDVSVNPNILSLSPVVIVKKPGSNTIYYVFTQSGWVSQSIWGLRYTTVDMSLASGLGAVIAKNDTVYVGEQTQKLAATLHCNGTDVWILTHDLNSSQFRAHLVTAAGVNTVGVISSIGEDGTLATLGQMKFSPNGRKIAYTSSYFIHTFDFDNVTGVVSNSLNLGPAWLAEGCEFSPDGTKLYASNSGVQSCRIYQWNLATGSNTAIVSSMYTYTSMTEQYDGSPAMQLGIDGKIYFTRYGALGLGRFENPNLAGNAAGINFNGVSVYPSGTPDVLPTFMSSYFCRPLSPVTFTINPLQSCSTVSFSSLELNPSLNCNACGNPALYVNWLFGDPASGNSNVSPVFDPVHQFSSPGTYTVQLIATFNCRVDTLKTIITINGPLPAPVISGQTQLCEGNTLLLTASGADSYNWDNGVVTNVILVTPTVTTMYTVIGTNTISGCAEKTSITVTVSQCLGLAEQLTGNEVMVFPNPFKNEFIVNGIANGLLEIFDQAGKRVFCSNLNSAKQTVSAGNLSPGMYILKITNGDSSRILKLIKLD